MNRLLTIFFMALVALSSCKAADPQLNSPSPAPVVQDVIITPELRNSCAIIATEAYTRLRATGVWTQMLYLAYKDEKSKDEQGHMVTVWQSHVGGPTLVYDQYFWDSTAELDTNSRDLNEVVSSIGRTLPGVTITRFHYLP